MSPVQLSFLEPVPDGFEYRAELVSPDEEADLLKHFRKLDLREFEFHGFLGKRRVISFGQHYDFAAETLHNAEEIPGFLLPLRQRAADFAQIAASDLPHALSSPNTRPAQRSGPPGTFHSASTSWPAGRTRARWRAGPARATSPW